MDTVKSEFPDDLLESETAAPAASELLDPYPAQLLAPNRRDVLPLDQIRQMRNDGLFSDVTLLLSSGTELHAHKAVLVMHSGYAFDFFSQGNARNFLDVSFLNPAIVPSVLDFIYEGAATVPRSLLGDLLDAGVKLGVHGLNEDALQSEESGDVKPGAAKRPRKTPAKSNGTSSKEKKKSSNNAPPEQFTERKEVEYMKAGSSFVCKYCFKALSSTKSVERHIESHFQATRKMFNCMRCDYKTGRKDSLKAHCVKQHDMEKAVFDAVMKEMEAQENGAEQPKKVTKKPKKGTVKSEPDDPADDEIFPPDEPDSVDVVGPVVKEEPVDQNNNSFTAKNNC